MSKSTASASVSFASIANAIGQNLGALCNHELQGNALREVMNKEIAKLHTGKVTVGTYRKDGTGCAIATAFIDGCVSSGIAAGTAQKVYLPTFKQAVASGKPVTDWNSQRAKAKAKAKGKGKGGKGKGTKTLADKLATCYRDADFAGFVADLQASYENAEGELIDLIKSYLEAEGIELKDAE